MAPVWPSLQVEHVFLGAIKHYSLNPEISQNHNGIFQRTVLSRQYFPHLDDAFRVEFP